MSRSADCHPDRPHWARGLCTSCYQRWWKETNPERAAFRAANRRPAPCHPNKPVLARDLCGNCYRAWWRSENKERERESQREYQRTRYQTIPEVREKARRRGVEKRYGISADQYAAMVDMQGGRCAACGEKSTKTLHVDHCHTTETIRGLLCYNCNAALGHAKDDTDRLLALVAYITS